MHRLSTCLLALTAMLACTASAQALLIYDTSSVLGGTGTITGVGDQVTASWTSTPFTSYIDFSIDTEFSLVFDSFVSSGSISDVSAYTLDLLDVPMGSPVGPRITDDTNFANSAVGVVSGDANLFAIPGATNALASTPGSTLLSALSPGSYRLGVYDSATPLNASAVFSIVAVPEPGAVVAWTLLSSVGLVTLGRRRR